MKKVKKLLIGLSIVSIGFIGYGFADNYFEVSKNLDIFGSLFKELNTYYVDDVEPGQLMKTGIDAMLSSLDPYTNYIPESQIEDYKFMTTGQYGGIGALIHREGDSVVISEPYKGFPAYNADLKAGDVLLSINGKDVKGHSTSEVSELLKGQPKTEISIKIRRPGTEGYIVKTVVRDVIKINDVPYYGVLENNLGYIKLVSFTQTAGKEFTEALKALKSQNVSGYVIDLRGNGGGLLNEAVNIVNVLVPKGRLVVETKGKLEAWNTRYHALNNPVDTVTPVVVLVNGSSASASEIVAGTLQDYDRAVIVGHQTFGKGLVQMTRPLSYNAQMKVTVAKYYIPSGRCIQKIDYSHKNENGEAELVPDSLIKSFHTITSNREVFDGNGIKPDVETEKRTLGVVSAALYSQYHLFHYATKYRIEHDTIASAFDFKLTDNEYQDFVNYMKEQNFTYQTSSEKVLENLIETSKKEMFYTDIEKEIEELKAQLELEKSNALVKFKDEITPLLENEIVSRYYYQNGRILSSLAHDDALKTASAIFAERYGKILSGSKKSNQE